MDKIINEISSTLKEFKTIGFLISGGVNSAVLYYLANSLRVKLKTNNTFKVFTTPKYDGCLGYAFDIVNYVDQKFNIKTDHYIVGDPDLLQGEAVRSGFREALPMVDILLIGNTSTPDIPNGPNRVKSTHQKIREPFFDYKKDTVLHIATNHQINDVFKLSHSCTQTVTVRCNECWKCKEREWAFKQVGYKDPKTY